MVPSVEKPLAAAGAISSRRLTIDDHRPGFHDPGERRPESLGQLVEERPDVGCLRFHGSAPGQLPKRREQQYLHPAAHPGSLDAALAPPPMASASIWSMAEAILRAKPGV